MTNEEWNSPFVRCLGMLLSGDTIDVQSFEGGPIRDNTFLLLINAHHEPVPFVLPGPGTGEMGTRARHRFARGILPARGCVSGDEVEIKSRSTLLIKLIQARPRARHESWKKRHSKLRRMASRKSKDEE